MKAIDVPVLRRFLPVKPLAGGWDIIGSTPTGRAQRWHELEHRYRLLILAEPGAGKTYEARAQATGLHRRGKWAFFIRIERIDADFTAAFEVGTAEEFTAWLASTDEAWFFLDSVDEAQLGEPRALGLAITLFADRIRAARERAHICITSRGCDRAALNVG